MEELDNTEIQRDTIRALRSEFVEYLNPLPIIDSIRPAIPDEVSERIHECQHRRDGVSILIDHVIQVQDDNSTLNLFISALAENGYQRFVDKFDGKNQSNHLSDDYWEFLIKMMRGDMQRLLLTPDIVPELVSRGCLIEEDSEAIECARQNDGDIASCRKLFERLPRLKTRWAWEFFEALRITNQAVLISKVNPAATGDELAQKGIIIPLNENTPEDRQIQRGEGQSRSVDNRHDAEVCTETVLYHRGDADLDDMAINVRQLSLSSSSDDDYADSDYEKEGFEKGDDEESEKGKAKPIISLRNYQHELAENALRGVNTIICADTGSGKTWVCLHIVKTHLDKMNGKGKVVFMAKTNPLVQQQYQIFYKHIPEYSVCHISKDSTIKEPIESLKDYYDIFFMTPQILVNHIERKHVGFKDFSLFIFDECHHTVKGEQYNTIMRQYIQAKRKRHTEPVKLPQVIGLTASIGIGKADTEEDAVTYMLNICANMDVDEISTVEKYKDDMRKHVPVPSEEHVKMAPRYIDPCSKIIKEAMLKIEEKLKNEIIEDDEDHVPVTYPHYMHVELRGRLSVLLRNIPQDHQTKRYQKWCTDVKHKAICEINDTKKSRAINTAMSYLLYYYDALEVNYLMNIEHVVEYLEDKFRPELEQQRKMSRFERSLLRLYTDLREDLRLRSNSEHSSNPNVHIVLQNLEHIFSEHGGSSRGIVFVQTRATAFALAKYLDTKLHDQQITVKPFTGTRTKENVDGMTEEEKKQLLEKFRAGDVKLLVATSVGSEGIDVPECNIVLKYNYSGNEISIIQMRGRSRKRGGKAIYIGDQLTMHKDIISIEKAAMMYRALDQLKQKSPEEIRHIITDIQTKDIQQQEDQKRQDEMKVENRIPCKFIMNCVRCKELAIDGASVRLMSSHHVVDNCEFMNRIEIRELDKKVNIGGNMIKNSQIYCSSCAQKWGNLFIVDNIKVPILTVTAFVFEDLRKRNEVRRFRKWKDVYYVIEEITKDELVAKLGPSQQAQKIN